MMDYRRGTSFRAQGSGCRGTGCRVSAEGGPAFGGKPET